MSDAPNLTGVWDGFYTYPRYNRAVPFGATLIESPGWLTGSTHEIATLGSHAGAVLCATLEGHRSGNTVAFLKSYEGGDLNYQSVHYFGTVSADGTEVEGIWRITPTWSGRFLMIRSGQAETKKRVAAFERAGQAFPATII